MEINNISTLKNNITEYFKIIIIEDDEGLNKLIQKKLKKAGFDIDYAFTGKQALKKVKGEENELLLLDYKLPDMTALDLMKNFSQEVTKPNFVIITGKGGEKIAVELMQAGAKDYIVKDIEFQDKLVFRINKVCRELLTEKKLRLRNAALEATGESIYMLDKDNKFIFANKHYLKLLKENSKIKESDIREISGRKYSDIHPETDAKNTKKIVNEVFKTAQSIQKEHKSEKIERWSSRIYDPLKNEEKKVEAVVVTSRNITENKKSQNKLKKNEKQFRTFAENVPGVVSIYKIYPDDHRETMYLGPGLSEIIGEKLAQKVKNNPDYYFSLLPSDDFKQLQKKALEALKTNNRLDFEYRLKVNPAEYKWVRTLFNVTKQKDGVILWEGLILDITNRKKIEKELKESRSLYQTIIQASGTAITIIEEDDIISFINDRFTTLTGYTAEEVEGKMKWTKFIFEDDLKMMQDFHEKRLKDRNSAPQDYEFRFKHKNGEIKTVLIFVDFIKDIKKTIASLIDITERKKMEEDLKYRTNYFKSLFEDSPEAILTIDNNNCVINLNPAFEELFGYELVEIEGKNVDKFLVPEEHKENARHVTNTVLEGKYATLETVRKKKDGTEIEVSVIATPILVGDKQIGGFAIYRDISTRIRNEHIQDVLYNINKAVRETENIPELIEKIRKTLSIIVDTTNFYVALYEKHDDTITLPYMKDKKDDYSTFPAGKTLTAFVINTGKSLFGTRTKIKQLKEKGLVETIGADSKIWLGVPLKIKSEVIGVLTVQSYEEDKAYSREDLNILEMVAGEIAQALRYKQEAKKLVESEQRFRIFITSSATLNFLKDNNFKYLVVNKSFEKFLDMIENEIIGNTDFDILPYETAMQCRKSDKRAINANETIVLHEVIGDRIFEVRKFPVEIEGKTGVGGIMTDITERIASREKLEKSFEGTIRVISNTVEIRDAYTAGHQERVTELALEIADRLELSEKRKKGLEVAARVHDIGKIVVPAEILSKPTKLSDLEFSYIREHPKVGYNILKNVDFPWPIADIVYEHHERMDGSGYPRGIPGDEILLEAKIMSVADVVEAMSSHRPYRGALGMKAAIREIKKHKGKSYDPKVVDACLQVVQNGFEFKKVGKMGK